MTHHHLSLDLYEYIPCNGQLASTIVSVQFLLKEALGAEIMPVSYSAMSVCNGLGNQGGGEDQVCVQLSLRI